MQQIILLENIRLCPEEKSPTDLFWKAFAKMGDFYVNDAFSASHRSHGSLTVLPKFFPNKKAIGLHLQKELQALDPLLSPSHPFSVLIGGAKLESKIQLLETLLPKVDQLFLGGAIALPFLEIHHFNSSFLKQPTSSSLRDIVAKLYNDYSAKIVLPEDFLIASLTQDVKKETSLPKVASVTDAFTSSFPDTLSVVGIGPLTVKRWTERLEKSAFCFWNGPMAIYEVDAFAIYHNQLLEQLSSMNKTIIVGGGDLLASIHKHHGDLHFTYLSTGGGALLEWIEKEGHLPALDAILPRA